MIKFRGILRTPYWGTSSKLPRGNLSAAALPDLYCTERIEVEQNKKKAPRNARIFRKQVPWTGSANQYERASCIR